MAIVCVMPVISIILRFPDQAKTQLKPKIEQSPSQAIQTTNTIQGQLVIPKFDMGTKEYWSQEVGKPCSGSETSGFTDINAGTQVIVKNSVGEIIGTTGLEEGRLNGKESHKYVPTLFYLSCQFPFEVKNLPKSNFYTIQIASRNGELTALLDIG